MRKKPYTSEEIAKLEANPYTLQATSHRLQLTLEAKGKVLEMLEVGFTASKILRSLGYDTEMLGQASVDGLVYPDRATIAGSNRSSCGRRERLLTGGILI